MTTESLPEPEDEFAFLPEQAAERGLAGPLPRGERISRTLPDGRTLSALRWDGPVPRYVFLHGAGLNAHTWDTTIAALGAPALAIDLPGHGESSWREDAAYHARALAPDLLEALPGWCPEPVVLVGHSLGGLVAAAIAAAASERILAVAVLDITPGVDPAAGPALVAEFFSGPRDWASREEVVDRALAFGLGGNRRQAARGVYFNTRVRDDGRVEWKHHLARLATDAVAHPAPARALLSETGWADLAAVRSPLLLVRAAQGFVTEPDAADFARRLPAARVDVLPGTHNIQEQRPRELAALLREAAPGTPGKTPRPGDDLP